MKPSVGYTRTAIGLHWLMALAIITTFSVGLYMSDLSLSPVKLKLYSWHKWAGVTIFLLLWFRLAWRLTHRPPASATAIPAWQQSMAKLAHVLFYVLMIAVPLSGWLMSSAKGFQTVYFGLLPLPDLLGKNKALGETLTTVHQTLNFSLAGLLLLHVTAVMKHHLIERNDILARMLPFIQKL